MQLHYYKDDAGHTAIISGRGTSYTLMTLYDDQAVTFQSSTFARAEALLRSAGGEWTEMPVKTSEEALSAYG